MKEVNEMHEHYMGFKSQAAELKSRIGTYKIDSEKAIAEARECKRENLRLTYHNDELIEKVNYLESKFSSLVSRCKVSKEDLDAVEEMIQSVH
jgi:chromosome segregation ATPase